MAKGGPETGIKRAQIMRAVTRADVRTSSRKKRALPQGDGRKLLFLSLASPNYWHSRFITVEPLTWGPGPKTEARNDSLVLTWNKKENASLSYRTTQSVHISLSSFSLSLKLF